MLPTDPDAAPETGAPSSEAEVPAGTPIPTTIAERRRGWPFAVSIVLVAILGGSALFMSGYSIGARDRKSVV